ncbi:GNAT family N-acetyltransferase [Streptomyces sp. 8L]|uniref:GNAT family N-acetyltransferase n=1 Tax=Streptomyces sp. 8L TaxID=2877242 RepID=UPI001CD216A8|nr:GNAT family N-acetyltransferase [Streptomyces sp. 8L]MCA1217864.1 GNAT family N-acetyltransferase [Streptomyces sp. 8L]
MSGTPPNAKDEEVAGFAAAWTTSIPLPHERCYPQVTAALGPERCAEWLGDAREVDELAGLPSARAEGLGSAPLAAVTESAPEHRCWLLTSARAEHALRFYRRVGWHRVTHPAPGSRDPVVFLSPLHPGATDTGPMASNL